MFVIETTFISQQTTQYRFGGLLVIIAINLAPSQIFSYNFAVLVLVCLKDHSWYHKRLFMRERDETFQNEKR